MKQLGMVLDLIYGAGARIVYEPLAGGRAGEYRHRTHTVALDLFLTPIQELCTAAHEASHAHHRDVRPAGRTAQQIQEARADADAARLLINPRDYVAAEAIHGPRPGAIAEELGVSRWVVETYQAQLDLGRAWARRMEGNR